MEYCLPKMWKGVNEVILTKWLKKPGDNLKLFEPFCEIETDKVTLDLDLHKKGGLITQLLVREGDVIRVGQPIAIIETGENKMQDPYRTSVSDEIGPSLSEMIDKMHPAITHQKTF